MILRFSIRDFQARLRRPQFGLRLMLMIVALFAVIFGWRAAVDRKHGFERQVKQQRLEAEIATLERLFRDAPHWKPIHGPRLAEDKNELADLTR